MESGSNTAGTEPSLSPLTALRGFEGNASDWRPLFEDFSFPGFPVSKIGERHNERFNTENHRGVIGEVDVDAVITGFGGQFDAFNDLALDFGKAGYVTCLLLRRFFTIWFSHDAPRLRCGQGRVHAVNMDAARFVAWTLHVACIIHA